MAKSRIIDGLREAVRHARCANRHVEHHVTTEITDRERVIKCMKCGHEWREQDRDGISQPFTLTTWKDV